MKPKYYWLLSDGKTIRELTREQYRNMAIQDMRQNRDSHLFAVVWDSEVYFGRGRKGINIRRFQLDKILGDDK